jgi:A/G-specific adenine glycosylase
VDVSGVAAVGVGGADAPGDAAARAAALPAGAWPIRWFPPPAVSRTIANTSTAAPTASRPSRRYQYTWAGSGPLGWRTASQSTAVMLEVGARPDPVCGWETVPVSGALAPELLLPWYAAHSRELPWRAPGAGAWPVLVSEVMLQQTPVSRVLPAYTSWLDRWPTVSACARASPAEVVRAWGRLGYPRRALRLREAAAVCEERFHGAVPGDPALLRQLPGVGEYTAAAVAAFAGGTRIAVVDTNVKRVQARSVRGVNDPRPVSAADRRAVAALLPAEQAARWSVAVMELGALVCTARAPRCTACPLRADCAWLTAGAPAWTGPTARPQGYAGTDRQVRGLILAALRAAPGHVPIGVIDACWSEPEQRNRALASLVADGLAVPGADGGYALPGGDRGYALPGADGG